LVEFQNILVSGAAMLQDKIYYNITENSGTLACFFCIKSELNS